MVGKMLLPYLGGAASVWTTCVLFFQSMLLLGYVYAHLLARIADVRRQFVLYASSNAGSLLALLAYPFLIEPRIGVSAQSRLWFFGYLGLLLLLAISIAVLYQSRWPALERTAASPIDWQTRFFWIAAAFVPS